MSSAGPQEAAWRVAAWIGAAYWFTASTSFANPAITIGRALSDTFAGIRPVDAPAFILAQLRWRTWRADTWAEFLLNARLQASQHQQRSTAARV